MMKKQRTTISAVVRGIWLHPGHVETCITSLLLGLLEPTQPDVHLRYAIVEELNRRVKRRDVIIRHLGLQDCGRDPDASCPLWLVAPPQAPNPWQRALLLPGGDCPLGFVVNTCDYGKVVLLHHIFQELTAAQQAIIHVYASLAVQGKSHARIIAALTALSTTTEPVFQTLQQARRRMQGLAPSVLFSPDSTLRVQVGSISQTTKNLIREGIQGDYLFILPKDLFAGKTNYADVEFMVYLNFFLRHGLRTRIAGTARQRASLERSLQITLFGLFTPGTPPPSFAELRQRYNVPDYDTYAFFRMLHEHYGTRRNAQPTGAILGVDAYLDFLTLDEAEPTTLALVPTDRACGVAAHTVRIVPHPHGTFAVQITQADGRSVAKTLEAYRPDKASKLIPEELCRAICFATDRPRFGVTPLGTSHGFDPCGDFTCFVIWINGYGILVDPSPEALGYLEQMGIPPTDVPYVFLTHVHADHDGGLIEKLLSGSRTAIIASDVVFRLFIEKAHLVTGYNFQQLGLVEHVPANPGTPVVLELAGERLLLSTRWNVHPIPTNGFTLTVGGYTFGYAGDTQYDPELFRHWRDTQQLTPGQYDDLMHFFWTPEQRPKVHLLYHEAGIPPIHTDKHILATLSESVKATTFLVHVADRDVSADFRPGKPPLFATQVLLPATTQSRAQTLLHTLRMVSYLYDAPPDILGHLLYTGRLKVFAQDEKIIHSGQVAHGAPLAFYVITDGQVVVQEQHRVLSRLVKTDSFGEWGISHQHGFRVADVMACRATQVIEFNEAAYYAMIEAHPVISQRIGRIRELLPRLQVVRAHARQKSAQNPLRMRSVIEDMTSGQLAAFAVLSEMKRFQYRDTVTTEGEEAHGFYILLSGHLTVLSGHTCIGELSAADVFGEIGLLTASGRRTASIQVASADAEVLFMSREHFHTLLHKVPVFSFGIHTIAAQRQTERRNVPAMRYPARTL